MKSTILIILSYLHIVMIWGTIHKLGEFDTDMTPGDLAVSEGVAYAVELGRGMQIIDVSNPLTSHLECNYSDYPYIRSIQIVGQIAYAISNESGLLIFDITNPIIPQLIGSYFIHSNCESLTISDNMAYVATGSIGLLIIDVSNPQNPQFVGSYLQDSRSYVYSMKVHEHTLYVSDYLFGLQILDVSNPQNPILIGSYHPIVQIADFEVVNNLLYAVEYGFGLEIIDVSNPQNPILIGSYDTPGYAISLEVVNEIAYIADNGSAFLIVDVSNPQNPQLICSYDTHATIRFITVVDGKAYAVENAVGIQIIDVSNYENPELLGSYATTANAGSIAVENNIAFIADYTYGMQIIDVSTSSNPLLISSLYPGIQFSVYSIAVSDGIAYITTEDGLQIYDMSDPVNPVLLAVDDDLTNSRYLTVVGSNAYAAIGRYMLIYDISNPQDPHCVSSIQMSDFVKSICVDGNYAYIADAALGLYVVDISNHHSPQLQSHFWTTAPALSIAVKDGIAFIAESNGQVQMIDVSDPSSPISLLNYLFHPTSQITGVYIKNNNLFIADKTLNEIVIYDISNIWEPILVRTYSWNLHTNAMVIENGKLYTSNGAYGMNIFDLDAIVPVNDQVAESLNQITLSSYPNPFNPSTTISFTLPKTGNVELDIYNIKGQKVKSLLNEPLIPGQHTISWNASDDDGHAVASGVYFARISAEGKTSSRKLVLVK